MNITKFCEHLYLIVCLNLSFLSYNAVVIEM